MASKANLTIDELARATGMTVRNVRAHQSRGLLPPMEVRVRTGYYGSEHVERLRLIQDLQTEGFNLKAIKRLLDAADGSGEALLELPARLLASFTHEEPELTTVDELQHLGGPFDEKVQSKGLSR